MLSIEPEQVIRRAANEVEERAFTRSVVGGASVLAGRIFL